MTDKQVLGHRELRSIQLRVIQRALANTRATKVHKASELCKSVQEHQSSLPRLTGQRASRNHQQQPSKTMKELETSSHAQSKKQITPLRERQRRALSNRAKVEGRMNPNQTCIGWKRSKQNEPMLAYNSGLGQNQTSRPHSNSASRQHDSSDIPTSDQDWAAITRYNAFMAKLDTQKKIQDKLKTRHELQESL